MADRLLASATGVVCCSCAFLGAEDRFVPEVARAGEATVSFDEPFRRGYVWGMLRVGGSPGVLRVEGSEASLVIRSRAFAFDQYTVGPILPVFPVPMGAGAYRPRLEVDIAVERAPGAFQLRADAVRVLADGESAPRAPVSFVRGAGREEIAPGPSGAGPFVLLVAGESARFAFELDNWTTPGFELTLPLDFGAVGEETLKARFRQERATYLYVGLPFSD